MDLDIDEVKKWFQEYHLNILKLADAKLTCELLPEPQENGRDQVAYNHVASDIPLIVSNRVFVVSYYRIDRGDEFIFLTTSRGNENLLEKYKEKIGTDVVGFQDFNYWHFKPFTDSLGEVIGLKCTHVVRTKPGGAIPNMLVSRVSQL